MLHRSKTTQTALRRGLFFTAAIVGLAHVALADAQPATVAPLMISGNQSARPPGTYSAGLAQIVKLLDAKMDAQVILAYIQNSPVAYNPDATELIALKDHGASPDVLVALLHHGDELRRQWAQAQRSVYPQPATTGYGYGNVPEGTYPAYPYGYSDVSYPTTYPVTYYNYGWPAVYWPPVPFNGYRPNLPADPAMIGIDDPLLGRGTAKPPDSVWVIEYREVEKETLIRTTNGRDMPTRGRFWIEPSTGQVAASEMIAEDPVIKGTIDVEYQIEPAVGLLVPVEMRERYEIRRDGSRVEGTATYGRFRQFQVKVDEKLAPIVK
jgi:hypothetical protein